MYFHDQECHIIFGRGVLQFFVPAVIKGPRSFLCTQVPCLAVKKWNRSIITESNIFCKYIIPIIRKEYALLF